MNLKRLWCLLVIIAFSMPLFAVEAPRQIDSFDDINDVVGGGADPNWVESTAVNYGSYMKQALVGGANEVNEPPGSMKIDFTEYVWPVYDDEPIRTFDPVLDFNNYEELAITLWVWIKDPNDSRRLTLDSRLMEIILRDRSARVGRFSVLPVKNVGWNKVIAPLRNFDWEAPGDPNVYPNAVDWNDINSIGLRAHTEDPGPPTYADNNAIYIDDMRIEWAPAQPNRPYQVASMNDINDELWEETHGSDLMIQTPPGDPCTEGDSSMMINFVGRGVEDWDITPTLPLIPALDFNDGNDWAITVWVWSDLELDSYLWEVILHDVGNNKGRYRIPRADINTGYGWNKVTARIDELLWDTGGGLPNRAASEVCLDAIVAVDLWAMCFPHPGNNIYLDDLRIEPAVEALSEAVVYNADYGTINVDGNPGDWDSLVDSDPIDFDLATINYTSPSWAPASVASPWPHSGSGDLHVEYRLAWDYTYLYILVEEQAGDNLANEAPSLADFMFEDFDDAGTYFDAIALAFDFTNNRLPGVNVQMGLWLYLGLSSSGRQDLMGAMLNSIRGKHNSAPIDDENNDVRTSGTWAGADRVIEARLKWATLDTAINSWFRPAGGIAAAVQPGYIFGCDPRLLDTEGFDAPWTSTQGMGWFSGVDDPVGWPQGYYRWPTGRDTFSTDIRLVCSAGDLDFDCDVDFVDYAQFAAEWYETGCSNLNDFCNGADILTPMNGKVDPNDLDRFTESWLD